MIDDATFRIKNITFDRTDRSVIDRKYAFTLISEYKTPPDTIRYSTIMSSSNRLMVENQPGGIQERNGRWRYEWVSSAACMIN